MSVVVILKSVEFLVDLMRFPGQLVPFSSKAVITSHISATGESDSADYDSCDSPLEPNSPLCAQRYIRAFPFVAFVSGSGSVWSLAMDLVLLY